MSAMLLALSLRSSSTESPRRPRVDFAEPAAELIKRERAVRETS